MARQTVAQCVVVLLLAYLVAGANGRDLLEHRGVSTPTTGGATTAGAVSAFLRGMTDGLLHWAGGLPRLWVAAMTPTKAPCQHGRQFSTPLLVYVDSGWQYALQSVEANYLGARRTCKMQGMKLPTIRFLADQRALFALCDGSEGRPSSCWMDTPSAGDENTCSAAMMGVAPVASACGVPRGVVCVSVDPATSMSVEYQDDGWSDEDEEAFQREEGDAWERMAGNDFTQHADIGDYSDWDHAELTVHTEVARAEALQAALREEARAHALPQEKAQQTASPQAKEQLTIGRQKGVSHHLRGTIGSAAIDLVASAPQLPGQTHFGGGKQYSLQPEPASYRDAWETCRAQGLELAGTEWLPDLTAITLLCARESVAPGGCWLVSADGYPGGEESRCTYRTAHGAVAYSPCTVERTFLCVAGPRGRAYDRDGRAADIPAGAQTTRARNIAAAAAAAVAAAAAELADPLARAVASLNSLQDRARLAYEEDELLYLLFTEQDSYPHALEFCQDKGVDIAGVDWSVDRRAMDALCSNNSLTPNGCWLARPPAVDSDVAGEDTCLHTTGRWPGESGPCDAPRAFVCVFVPSPPALSGAFIPYLTEAYNWAAPDGGSGGDDDWVGVDAAMGGDDEVGGGEDDRQAKRAEEEAAGLPLSDLEHDDEAAQAALQIAAEEQDVWWEELDAVRAPTRGTARRGAGESGSSEPRTVVVAGSVYAIMAVDVWDTQDPPTTGDPAGSSTTRVGRSLQQPRHPGNLRVLRPLALPAQQ